MDELATAAVLGFVAAVFYAWRRSSERGRDDRTLAQTQRALAVAREHDRSLFEYHPVAIFAVGPDGRFTATNTASSDLTGYSDAELRNRHFTDLVAPGDRDELLLLFQTILERQPRLRPLRLRHRDGHLVEINLTGVPIVVNGEVMGAYGIADDMTERHRTERELVRTRLAAQQANAAKSHFLTNVSHEIRTPLTGMLATTELLADTDLDPVQERFIDIQQRSGQRLLALVNDILDFSGIEAGTTGVVRAPLDISAVLNEVAGALRPAATCKGLSFRCTLDPGLPQTVLGDPVRLAQAVRNLLENAIKFTDRGTVVLSATASAMDENEVQLVVAISDTGIGIDPDGREYLFEAFRQADPSITRKYGGTGLGLAISHQLVTHMGGAITVESTPGIGSVFRLTLTLQVPET